MKIGIYGDSYAAANHPDATKWYEVLAKKIEEDKPVEIKKSFFNFFKKSSEQGKIKFGEKVELNVYSWAGSSFYYTYNAFKKNYSKNDLNIVLVTNPGRYSKHLLLTSTKLSHVITSEPQIDSLMNLYSGQLTPVDKNKLIFLRGWFKSQDYDYVNDMQELMMSHMESLDNHVLFYPCFSDSMQPERCKKLNIDIEKNHMHMFWHRQLELLNLTHSNFEQAETTNMCGHLGPEFNEFFANILFKKLKTEEWDHSGFLDVTLKHSLPFYYKVEP